jgi:hypothetical protein
MKWGEGNKQIQAAKCDPFAAWNLEQQTWRGMSCRGGQEKTQVSDVILSLPKKRNGCI